MTTITQKPLRDAHGHFISAKPKTKKNGISINTKPLPKKVKEVHAKLLADIDEHNARTKLPVKQDKKKVKPPVSPIVHNIKDLEYTVYHDHTTNKDITIGKLKQSSTDKKSEPKSTKGVVKSIVTVMKYLSEKPKSKETTIELPQLWRYTKDGVDMFRIAIEKPIDSESCVPIFKFYDLKRDILALKRAINVYETTKR